MNLIPTSSPWLLLVHQVPPKPDYLRVKIWRHMQGVGAVLLKNALYVMPRTERALEDLQWVRRQILDLGGEATLMEAKLVDGLKDQEVEDLFRAARNGDYETLAEEARKWIGSLADPSRDPVQLEGGSNPLTKLRRKFAEIEAIDFFGAPRRAEAEGAILGLERAISARVGGDRAERPLEAADGYRGRTWVTRTGVHVDRIACAWLIRRFIDPSAGFRFVDAKAQDHREGELRFDMFEGEFTHEGSMCTFEVMLRRMGMEDSALQAVAELVHDLDLKEDRFGRPETAGFGRAIQGICRMGRDDEGRIARGSILLDALYAAFGGSAAASA